MHKETKALLHENNQRETLLSPNFQSVLTDMVVYLRASRLPFSLQEQVRRDITDMFLAGQEKGASPAEIIGMDFQEYCDRLLQELPQNNRRTQTLCTIRDMSLVLCVGMAVLFLPELIGVLLSHTPFGETDFSRNPHYLCLCPRGEYLQKRFHLYGKTKRSHQKHAFSMAVCGFYTTVFPEKTRLGNSILHFPPRLCRPASVLRTAEPFSGLISKRKHETFYYI